MALDHPEDDRRVPARHPRDNFALFEKYPDYVFSFEGAFRYQLMQEYYPAEYARMKQYVADGPLARGGSWVDAVDTNIPSPESLIRHALYGNGCFAARVRQAQRRRLPARLLRLRLRPARR